MVKLAGFIISIFLVCTIVLRLPPEIAGLTSFTQKFIDVVTAIGILFYLGIAIQLNFYSQ